jgi:prepilin-type N-terminal cleavage/methylation domain-containing protein
MRRNGFTLIELLIVIGIIGFLAAAILVAVDPVKRIQDSRDSRRSEEVYSVLNALLNKQVDDRRLYDGEPTAPIDTNAASSQVIVTTTAGVNCTIAGTTPTCPGDGTLTLDTSGPLTCVVLLDDNVANTTGVVDVYISELPIDPIGSGKDPTPNVNDLVLGTNNTGYFLNRTAGNRIEIGACHPEQASSIRVKR